MFLIEDRRFYVYCYLNPLKPGNYCYNELMFNYEPFYIGKGSGHRQYVHLKPSVINNDNNKLKINTIKKILKLQLKPIIIKIKEHLTTIEAEELEQKIIYKIGRRHIKTGPLTNYTKGGEGTPGLQLIGSANGMFGKKHSPQSIQKIKISKKLNKQQIQYKHPKYTSIHFLNNDNNNIIKEKIISLYVDSEISIRQICRSLNMQRGLVYKILNSENIPIRSSKKQNNINNMFCKTKMLSQKREHNKKTKLIYDSFLQNNKNKIIKMYKTHTASQIAQILNISLSLVRYYLRKSKTKKTIQERAKIQQNSEVCKKYHLKSRRQDITIEKIQQLRKQNLTYKEIATILHCSLNLLYSVRVRSI